jgi:histidine triad (HIT) family protein
MSIFQRIIDREIPAQIVFENERLIAFNDVHPQAPIHVLFVPKQPLPTLNDARIEDAQILGELLLAASAYAREQGFADAGFRCVINCNGDGGQSVFQLHVHLLAGRTMQWPPG